MRRKTSQPIVVTRIKNADSRYQVSDFCECIKLDTREREDESKVSRFVYDSESVAKSFVEFSKVS